jgi:hypothetical protein
MTAEARKKLGKMFGRLGSAHAGEVANAVDAINKQLPTCGMTWSTVSDLVAYAGFASDDAVARRSGKLIADLVRERLDRVRPSSWSYTADEAKYLLAVTELLDGDPANLRTLGALDALERGLRVCVAVAKRTRIN